MGREREREREREKERERDAGAVVQSETIDSDSAVKAPPSPSPPLRQPVKFRRGKTSTKGTAMAMRFKLYTLCSQSFLIYLLIM